MLRWVFAKGNRYITCSLEMIDDGSSFEVHVLPHWDPAASTVQCFSEAAIAFDHHAELVGLLREFGWCGAQNSPRHAIAAA